jgi:hypothetical protein
MNVIFGTWNRVSRTCSNNPKLATANMTQLAHKMRFGAQNEALPQYRWDRRMGGRRCLQRAEKPLSALGSAEALPSRDWGRWM